MALALFFLYLHLLFFSFCNSKSEGTVFVSISTLAAHLQLVAVVTVIQPAGVPLASIFHRFCVAYYYCIPPIIRNEKKTVHIQLQRNSLP